MHFSLFPERAPFARSASTSTSPPFHLTPLPQLSLLPSLTPSNHLSHTSKQLAAWIWTRQSPRRSSARPPSRVTLTLRPSSRALRSLSPPRTARACPCLSSPLAEPCSMAPTRRCCMVTEVRKLEEQKERGRERVGFRLLALSPSLARSLASRFSPNVIDLALPSPKIRIPIPATLAPAPRAIAFYDHADAPCGGGEAKAPLEFLGSLEQFLASAAEEALDRPSTLLALLFFLSFFLFNLSLTISLSFSLATLPPSPPSTPIQQASTSPWNRPSPSRAPSLLWAMAASSPSPTSAAGASTAPLGATPAPCATSKTCLTTSSRAPSSSSTRNGRRRAS